MKRVAVGKTLVFLYRCTVSKLNNLLLFISGFVSENKLKYIPLRNAPEPQTPLLERLVKQFRLRPDQAAEVLEKHSIEVINRQLYDIHTKANDGKVKNLGSYTAKVFGLETTKGDNNYTI